MDPAHGSYALQDIPASLRVGSRFRKNTGIAYPGRIRGRDVLDVPAMGGSQLIYTMEYV